MTTISAPHRSAPVEEWVEAYSGGERVDGATIYSSISEALCPVLAGYRYFRSKAVFCDKGQDFDRYVRVIRGKGIVSLQFGLSHHAIEKARELLFGKGYEFGAHHPSTISMTTTNIGPHSKAWHLPYQVQWPIIGSHGLRLALPEICEFVHETALPYVELHRDIEVIRDTYLANPRRADFYARAERIIYAVNYLKGDATRLHDDYALLTQRPLPLDELNVISAGYESTRQALNAA